MTPRLRVRTGCLTCRARKKKCDEGKPKCRGCTRNHLECQWPQDEPQKQTRQSPERSSYRSEVANGSSDSSETPQGQLVEELAHGILSEQQFSHSSPSESPWGITDTGFENLDCFEQSTLAFDGNLWGRGEEIRAPETRNEVFPAPHSETSLSALNETIPAHPRFMPHLDHVRFSLFGHYIQTTANSMANGATSSNPFLVQLLPLTVSSDLVLEAILAQSCAHRAVRAPNVTDSEALSLYNKSLRSLRTALETISGQPKEDLLGLIVSMLVLCFTETARGDTTGSIFFHLQATSSLLPGALIKLKGSLPNGLRKFLLEYYLYTAALSMISMDAVIQSHTVFCSQLLQEGYELVETGYIGNLCGCWLELILFIPQVFDLGSQWINQFHGNTAERIMAFSLLQLQISNWKPSENVHPDVALVGKVYQQAMLLYLLSILGDPRADESSLHSAKIQEATSQAMLYLEHLPATKQINTSLCWPLAVVGSCVLHQQQQEQIRNRLKIMTRTIGLGNISKTKDILDYVWSQGFKGPWKISKAMQASGIWISFA